MSLIIDKRAETPIKSFDNRKRFLKRQAKQIRKKIIGETSVLDFESLVNQNELAITLDVTEEPFFALSNETGKTKTVYPGNTFLLEGDKLPKALSSQLSYQGETRLELTTDEFLEILFDDCELPNFFKKSRKKITESFLEPYGFSSSGCPSKLSLFRSYKESLLRRMAIKAQLQKQIFEEEDEEKLEELFKRLDKIPFFQDKDLRYHYSTKRPKPIKSATMIMIMDVSGSISNEDRYHSRLFFYLIVKFLQTKYNKISFVPILHADEAKVVKLSRFFREDWNGGTEFYPVYELVNKELDKINIEQENVYLCHTSDGEVLQGDIEKTLKLIEKTRLRQKCNLCIYGNVKPLDEVYGDGSAFINWATDSKFKLAALTSIDTTLESFLKLFKRSDRDKRNEKV